MLKNRIRIGNVIFGIFVTLLVANYIFAITTPTDQTDGSFRQTDFLISTIYTEESPLKLDDIITHMNGETLGEVMENRFAEKNYYNFEIGDKIIYTVEREGETIEIPIILEETSSKFKIKFAYNYGICLIIGAIGYLALITSPQTKHTLSLLFLCVGTSLTLAPGMFQAYNITFPFYMMMLYYVTTPLSAISIIAIPYFFFTFPTDILKNKKKLFVILNIVLLALLVVPPLLWPMEPILKHYWVVQGYYIFILIITALFLISVIWNFIKTKDMIKKQQLKYISLGFLLSILPVTTRIFFPFLIFRKVAPISYELVTTTVAIFPFMTTLAIKKYQLFNINKIVNKTLTYALTSLITTGVSILLFIVFSLLLRFEITSNTIISLIPVIIFTSVSAIPLQNGMENLWQKVFQRKSLDFMKASELILRDLAQVQSHDDLCNYIATILPRKLQMKSSLLVLIKEDGLYKKDTFQFKEWQVFLPSDNKDFQLLRGMPFISYIEEIPALSSPQIKEFKVVVPVVENEKTTALWLLGEKESEDFYYGEELKTIEIIAQQLGLSLINAKLLSDIEKKLEQEKNVIQKELELNKLKGEYITIISHFLRTPITAVKGYIDLIKQESKQKSLKEYLTGLESSIEKIHLITERIIIMSELENDKLKLSLNKESLGNLIKSLVQNVEAIAKENKINLTAEIEDDLFILMERNKLKQALENIIENAIIYNNPKGSVKIRLKKKEGNALITITDTGRGITEEEQEKLFTPFHRAHFEQEGFIKGEGIGIGIYLAKLIIDAHNGSIEYSSKLNKGTTVTINLPIAK